MPRNTLTAIDKCPVRDSENLSSPIQIQLSFKRKTLIDFFIPFLEYALNFKPFEKKGDGHSYFLPEITDCERVG